MHKVNEQAGISKNMSGVQEAGSGVSKAEKRLRSKSKIHALEVSTMGHVHQFAEFDLDGNAALDFEEFYAMQPKAILDRFSVKDIRKWFEHADKDGSGTLSVNEFFIWSLRNASAQHGSDVLKATFERYDHDNTGSLDGVEFAKVCEDLGFGSGASAIFAVLDEDGSGEITYNELIEKLVFAPPSDAETKQLLASAVNTFANAKVKEEMQRGAASRIDVSTWRIKGRDAETVRTELQAQLLESGEAVADLMRLFDQDGKGDHSGPLHLKIDLGEFSDFMNKIGYSGRKAVLHDVFDGLDEDGDGSISFHELFEFIRGRRHSLDPRTKGGDIRWRLPLGCRSWEDIAWEPDVVRTFIKETYERTDYNSVDLLKHWHAERGMTRKEFVAKMFETFFSNFCSTADDFWANELYAVVVATFETLENMVLGGNFLRRIGILHFLRWLDGKNRGDGVACTRFDVPNKYTIDTLPMKTMQQRATVRARRREQERLLEAAALAEEARHRKVDWVAKAKIDIARSAEEGRRVRESARQRAEDRRDAEDDVRVVRMLQALPPLHVQRGWEMSHAYAAVSRRSPRTSR